MPLQADLSPDEATVYENAILVLCSLSTIIVCLRLLSRKVSGIYFWWDDAFIVIATILAWATAAALYRAVFVGLGKPDAALDFHSMRGLFHINLALQEIYYCCIAMIKFSILAFYRRLFPLDTFRITTYVMIVIIAIWWIAAALISILNCTPISYNWDRTQPGGHCMNAKHIVVAVSIPNIATDIIILLLPLPVIWQMQLPLKKKWAVSSILSLGIFVIASSCIRLRIFIHSIHAFKDIPIFYLWTNIEPDIAIICACLPTLLPLFRYARDKLSPPASVLSYVYSKAQHSPPMSPWPRRKICEASVDTDYGSFAHPVDDAGLEAATSKAWPPGLLSRAGVAKHTEGDPAIEQVHFKNDGVVSHDRV